MPSLESCSEAALSSARANAQTARPPPRAPQLRQLVSLAPSLLVARGPTGRVDDAAQPFRPDFRAKVTEP